METGRGEMEKKHRGKKWKVGEKKETNTWKSSWRIVETEKEKKRCESHKKRRRQEEEKEEEKLEGE